MICFVASFFALNSVTILPFIGVHCEKRLKLWCLGWVVENWPSKLHKRWLCNKMLLLQLFLSNYIFMQFFVVFPFVSIVIISQIFKLQNHQVNDQVMNKVYICYFWNIHILYTKFWTCPNISLKQMETARDLSLPRKNK